MNSETALIVAIILGLLVLAAAYGALNIGVEGAGDSLFGDSDREGLFGEEPDEENPQFRGNSEDSTENTELILKKRVERKVV